MSENLIVVPTYIRTPHELEVTFTMLESLRRTEPDADVLLVDDGSPAQELVYELGQAESRLKFDLHRKGDNDGFSRTVNVGLRRALNSGQNAILVNADIEFIDTNWLAAMEQTLDPNDRPASVVGALLLYPNGLIQHAGIFFSLLHRQFDHIYKYAPADLPEAQNPRRCPVTGALQFIRHECLASVGVYDEQFRMGWEDVDYCLRVWMSERPVIYNPRVRAFHHESLFRGKASERVEAWQQESWAHFMHKHRRTRMSEFVPSLI